MKQFLAVYIGTAASMGKWSGLSETDRKKRETEGIAAWHAWGEKNENAIVVMGGPLGKTKSASPSGIADLRNEMTGFTVIQADSHEAAVKLFENHPHFAIFPGDRIEVMEILPIPGA
jgi:hypothetical protein